MRLLHLSERKRLSKLKEYRKLIKLTEEINGIFEENLEEDESNMKNINKLIYAAATTTRRVRRVKIHHV